MNKVGGASQLKSLFDPPALFQGSPSVKFKRGTAGWGTCTGMGACSLYNTVWFFDALFRGDDVTIRTTAVHELGHIIDHKHLARKASLLSHKLPGFGMNILTEYGKGNRSEYWAEAVAIWTYGTLYKASDLGKRILEPLQVQMLDEWLRR
jgi:hypothetical protein